MISGVEQYRFARRLLSPVLNYTARNAAMHVTHAMCRHRRTGGAMIFKLKHTARCGSFRVWEPYLLATGVLP